MKACFSLIVICLLISNVHAEAIENQERHLHATSFIIQDTIGKSWFGNQRRSYTRKSSFYLQAGFNWSSFGKSDINFDGPGYDFTLEDLSGHDEPYKLSLQYNIHGGYYFRDNYSISMGFDHMKYVIDLPQEATISGQIGAQVSSPAIPSGQYEGSFDRQPILVTPDLVTLEYTDGFNYLTAHLNRYDDVWVSINRKTSLALETGIGAGMIIPRSDVKLFGLGKNNKFNIAGWAGSVKGGLMLNLNKKVFFTVSLEAGYANMYRIYTTGRNDVDKASQKLNFLQNSYFLGYRF